MTIPKRENELPTHHHQPEQHPHTLHPVQQEHQEVKKADLHGHEHSKEAKKPDLKALLARCVAELKAHHTSGSPKRTDGTFMAEVEEAIK